MKKHFFAGLLAAMLLLLSIAPAVSATEAAASGSCGEGITWSYDNHTLTISGSGEMEDGSPWSAYKDKIEHVVFTGGVTRVGAKAFEDYDWLETVDFGDSMREIGRRAFYDCSDIVEIRLPETFRIFGEECFRNCVSLKRVICEGGIVPSFKSGCLFTGSYISVFYPPNNPWAWEYYNPITSAYGGMIGIFMASEEIMENGFAPETEPTEETEAVEETVAETEAVAVAAAETVPETTVATEPVTVPTTEAATEPTETTVPETTVPETTVMETEEPTVPTSEELDLFTEETEPAPIVEEMKNHSWIGIVLITGVLTFLLVGALIFRGMSRKGRY